MLKKSEGKVRGKEDRKKRKISSNQKPTWMVGKKKKTKKKQQNYSVPESNLPESNLSEGNLSESNRELSTILITT
jgi:hypothetical protein